MDAIEKCHLVRVYRLYPTKEYGLTRAKVQFKDLTVADVPQAVFSKQVNALLVIMPVSEKYLAILRAIYPSTGKQNMGILPIESAGAIRGDFEGLREL